MRLDRRTVARLAPRVAHPGYDCTGEKAGIVHFGLGAFARAHLAAYTDAAMAAGDRDWMITGVSLRSPDVAMQLNPQDGLYLVAERSEEGTAYRLTGSIRRVLVAPDEPEAVVEAIASPSTRIVSFTVTEKGYRRAADGSLDMALAGEGSFYPLLARALRQRYDAGLCGVTLLTCDNLAANGQVLDRLMREYLARTDPGLLDWFGQNCACPCAMVDRIVPATSDADKDEAERATGLRDEALVVTEPFSQWVIEDRFAAGRPQWEVGGTQLVDDVRPYEMAKLRMLNGAHSALAYIGLRHGHRFVHEAVADPAIRPTIEQLMRDEAATSLQPAAGQDLSVYADALLARFANPALDHRLAQIAMDGSQKIPQRWLEVLAHHQAAGRQCPALLAALAAWILHVRSDRHAVDDPMADHLAHMWRTAGRAGISRALFGGDGPFAHSWTADAGALAALDLLLGIDPVGT